LIECLTGRFFYPALEERFSSQTYQAFLTFILNKARSHLFLI
jgi:hypothetical protein